MIHYFDFTSHHCLIADEHTLVVFDINHTCMFFDLSKWESSVWNVLPFPFLSDLLPGPL